MRGLQEDMSEVHFFLQTGRSSSDSDEISMALLPKLEDTGDPECSESDSDDAGPDMVLNSQSRVDTFTVAASNTAVQVSCPMNPPASRNGSCPVFLLQRARSPTTTKWRGWC